VITGVHAIIFTKDPEQVRAFFQDILGFPSVDAGGGWLISETAILGSLSD
jgi:catechol 2,3-dioxygenase-like lactoylglutathione lyase family enzyme